MRRRARSVSRSRQSPRAAPDGAVILVPAAGWAAMIRTSHITKTMAALAAVMAVGATPALANSGVALNNGAQSGSSATADYYAADAFILFTELGKDNNIRVQKNNQGDYWFRDTLQPIDAGPGCSQITAKIVSCAPGNATQIRVHAFDGKNDILVDDNITLDTRLAGSGPAVQAIDGGGGRDWIAGGDKNDTLSGGPADDMLVGGDGGDVLSGDAGNDVIDGGQGGDTILAGGQKGLGADKLAGGPGVDTADYNGTLTGVTVSANGNAGDGAPGENDNVATDVENLYGTAYGDTLRGSDGAGTVYGRDGVDYLYGNDGDDTLIGGNQGDFLFAGAGDDQVYGSAGDDQLKGDGGQDKLYGSTGVDKLDGGKDGDFLYGGDAADMLYGGGGSFDDQLDGGLGADKLDGGPGEGDSVSYANRTNAVTADLTGSAGDDGETGEGDTIVGTVERLFGGTGDDKLTGNGNLNVITGGKGNDTIDVRGAGDDEAFGDDGDDTILSRDQILDKDTCGAGSDTVTADQQDGIGTDC